VLAVIVGALLIEGVARLGLLALGARGVSYDPISDTLTPAYREALVRVIAGTTRYLDYSPVLGWTLHPKGERPPLYHANAAGLRGTREYALEPPAGVFRISAFGESFTHGDEVPDSDAWPARLERPGVEVLNFGVGGYGLDQALLRYRLEGRQHHPRIVLIGFMAENINRSVSVYRPFYHPTGILPLSKPRFRVAHDTLVLIPNPMRSAEDYQALLRAPASVLPRLGADDYYYQTREHAGRWDVLAAVRLGKMAWRVVRQANGPLRGGSYNPRSEAFQVTLATLAEFVRGVRADGATPVVLLFPQRRDLNRYRRAGTRSYDPLRTALDEAGIRYLDLVDAFEGCRLEDVPALVPVHYSAAANARVAAYLSAALDSGGIRAQAVPLGLPSCALPSAARGP
jgi:hypothetical protein